MEDLFLPGIALTILIGIAYITGRLADGAHERALRRDEALLPHQYLDSGDAVPDDITLHDSKLVTGKVVIAEDRFRNLLARLRIFVGGRLAAHEATVTRAKREAILRLRTNAKGASHIIGLRFDSAELGRGMIEVIVSGTALYTDHRPTGGRPSALPDDGVNISHRNLLAEFASGSIAFLLICWGIYTASGLAVEWAANSISVQEEVAIWSELEPGLIAEHREDYERSLPERYLLGLVNSIPKEAIGPAKDYDFDVLIIPDDSPNAAALPGGLMLVHTGMLELVDTENELLSILGHEIGHYNGRDHLEGIGREVVGVALSAMMFQTDAVLTTWAASWPKLLADRDYSRSQELDADDWSLRILMAKYGHVAEASTTFAKLGQLQGDRSLLDYLSTHPHPRDRVERLEDMAREQGLPIGEPVDLQVAFENFLVRTGEIPASALEDRHQFNLTNTGH
ncbi:M48 family metallopeptidase [Thalassospira indica]|uniref:Peptidase M48 n=1 Tax=Thalassospira indica TaxID=1891279 RepID=A0ABM6Y230_9PROT|nr:M48 family metallopeptidase [Thalassospira indica]AXO15892.1 peptidase M48 [Thalassospira indica]OAZ13450.1 peptidase M48 [Thalassospira profundimaris]